MSWKDIDLFALEPTWFSDELRGVVVPFFVQNSELLAAWEQRRRKLLEKEVAEADGDEGELQAAHWKADVEDSHNGQRGQIVGAASLHYLYSTLKARLKELLRYFEKTHPRTAKNYEGKSQWDRLKNEYAQRVGLKFEDSPLFENIRELVLARNAGFPESMKEYTAVIKSPRFSQGDEFRVDSEQFNKTVEDTESFFRWVVESLIPIRKGAPAKQQPVTSSQNAEISAPPQDPRSKSIH